MTPKTIYNLLGRQANKAGALIELAKVKRENEALLKIIGSLVADSRLGKKRNKREVIVNYFSSSSSPAKAGDDDSVISKSVVAEKMSVSRQSLYYQPKLPTKDLLLKQQIEAVLLEHRAYGHRRIALALYQTKNLYSH